MIVCHCKGKTDFDIARCVRQQGDRTLEAVARRCGAGTDCGGCVPTIHEILASLEAHRSHPEPEHEKT